MDYLILVSSIVFGAFSVFWFKLHEPRHVKLLNALTGSFLLTLTFLHLLPELYENHAGTHDRLVIGALILAGFFVQVALDVISQGIEHGHAHSVGHHHLPFGVLAGLCLHAFVEALALGDNPSHHDPQSRQLLLWSIVVHNYPVSIALLGMLLHSGLRRGLALNWLGVFALMAPLGMFISAHTPLAHYSRELMAIVIGIFMHIATTILFEAGEAHRINLQRVGAIIIGAALGTLTVLFH
jgi:zinc transporter ZupT